MKRALNQTGRFYIMEKKEMKNYTIQLDDNLGEVVIAEDVVGVIAGFAAVEVDGVASMAGNATKELISKLGIKTLSKGVKVDLLEEVVTVSMSINLKYGYNVMNVCKKVQEKVKTAIENMTGLTVADINVRVAGIEVEASK